MDLLVLDKDFRPMGVVDTFESVTWDRSYYDVGSFSIATDMKYYALLRDGRYIFRNDADELGILQGLSYKQDAKSETVEAEGKFLEAILDGRVIEKTKDLKGTPEEISRQLVTEYCITPSDSGRKIPKLRLGTAHGLGTEIAFQSTGDTVLEKIQEICQSQELSFSMIYNFLADEIVFDVWKGKDRTQGQTVNTWATFSRGMENLITAEYDRDKSKYKNFAYVAGEGEDTERTVVTVDLTDGKERNELYVDARDLKRTVDDVQMSESDYQAVLKQRGIEKLDSYNMVESYNAKIDPNSALKYKSDYDLGDICTVVYDSLGVMVEKRIETIKETHTAKGISITVTFGKDYLSLGQAIKREVKH